MINISKFSTDNATKDDAVGILVNKIISTNELNAYSTLINKGKKIGCHSHSNGEEWYIILSGNGDIWTGDVINNDIKNIKMNQFSTGYVFCIHSNTAHQLVAHEDVKLIFLCPNTHMTKDRMSFDDICDYESKKYKNL